MDQLSESARGAASAGTLVVDWLKEIENEEAADNIREVAKSMGLLGQSVAKALPELISGRGLQFINMLTDLQQRLERVGQTDASSGLKKMIPVLSRALATGQDMGAALKEAGFETNEFFDLVRSIEGGTPWQKAKMDIIDVAKEVGHLQEAWRNFNRDAQANIALTVANEEAVKSLADKYGVSTDFIQQSLDKYTSGVAIMDQQTEESFAHAAHLVGDKSNEIVGAAYEAQQAMKALAEEVSTNLVDSFEVFGDLPEKFNKPMDKLLSRADELSDIAIQQGRDVRTLFERGVPAGLIEKILAEGPNAARRFAEASKPELRKLVTEYQSALGAMDAAILQEAVHQEGKGSSMVERFTTGILRRKTLPVSAAYQIVQIMTDAFGRGDVDGAGLRLVTSFANTVAASGLPEKAAGKIVLAFARRVASGGQIPRAGSQAGHAFASKLAEAAGITQAAAERLMRRAALGIQNKKHEVTVEAREAGAGVASALDTPSARSAAYDAGFGLMQQLASGIIDGLFAPLFAADQAVNDIRNKFKFGLQDSPKFFTYYMGKDLMKQLNEGMEANAQLNPRRALSRVLHHPTARIPAASSAQRRVDLDVDVRIDRRRHAQSLDHEWKARGF
jgi:hypothetical protein